MSRSDRDHRYNTSEKGRARHHRYNTSEKGRERSRRYEESRIQPSFCGARFTYRVSPKLKPYFLALNEEFKARQREEYREFSSSLLAEAKAMDQQRLREEVSSVRLDQAVA